MSPPAQAVRAAVAPTIRHIQCHLVITFSCGSIVWLVAFVPLWSRACPLRFYTRRGDCDCVRPTFPTTVKGYATQLGSSRKRLIRKSMKVRAFAERCRLDG